MHQDFVRQPGKCSIKCMSLLALLLLAVPSTSFALPVQFGVGPDNNQALLLSHIQSARENLTINIYLFDHPIIAQAIVEKINAGVTVNLLVEGQPFGAVSDNGRTILNAIASAMARSGNPGHQLLVMTKSASGEKRRYRYNHAKYVIVDHTRSLVSSENFTESGHANAGSVGNRGWETIVDDCDLAEQLEDIYAVDSDLSFGDVRRLKVPSQNVKVPQENGVKKRALKAISMGQGDARRATLITSPDALDELLGLLRSAKSAISIEHMGLPSNWRSAPNAGQNPVITELIRAAQRGVDVRVLLNDERVFSNTVGEEEDPAAPKRPNQLTVELLKSVAESENLPLAARIIDVRKLGITYLHNKGIVVDGTRALISSINGSQNSVMNNREVAILLESSDAARYYDSVFNLDWSSSGGAQRATNERGAFNFFEAFSL